MQILIGIAVVGTGYIIGSIPFGLLIVKVKTGKDIRQVESGRTGGTNVVRASEFWAGLPHGNGFVTIYAHLSAISVGECQSISAGAPIGVSGNTGGSPINPWLLLQ